MGVLGSPFLPLPQTDCVTIGKSQLLYAKFLHLLNRENDTSLPHRSAVRLNSLTFVSMLGSLVGKVIEVENIIFIIRPGKQVPLK